MSLVSRLTEIYLKFNRRVLFDSKNVKKHREMEDQKSYLEKLGKPKDQYEKAYFKYKCHAYYHYSLLIRIVYNFVGLIMVPFFAILLALKSTKKEFSAFVPDGAILIVSPTMGYKDIFPPQIGEKYTSIKEVKPLTIRERYMDREAWNRFGTCVARYWRHPFFCLEALIRISGNCELMYRYHPQAIIGYGWERDFIAPILLEYCKSKGVDRLTFMHGIFVYSIDKAFLSFTKYYVWEPYYVNMFTQLRASPESLEIYKPQKYNPIVAPRPEGVEYEYFLTYYFTADSKERMVRIKKCLDLFTKEGFSCKLRPHPRFTDLALLRELFPDYLIEDSSWTLADSMECSKYIAAYNSTVLAEAFYSNKEVLIDDYVDPSKFKNMIDRGYIMLSRPHKLMTEVVKESCDVVLEIGDES